MKEYPTFEDSDLEAICSVLGETEIGLTGSEIGRFLSGLGIEDPERSNTKRHRLFAALRKNQKLTCSGKAVVDFIHRAMDPVRFVQDPGYFEYLTRELNGVLRFAGYELGSDGKLKVVRSVSTLEEAEERAGELQKELETRGVHYDVLKYCTAELLKDDYFHAVFEATKSIAEKIRVRTGLSLDGSELVDKAFGLGGSGTPILAFNKLSNETEKSEHKGLTNILKGVFGAFRNVPGHAPRLHWVITKADAFDLLTLASLLHRRIDSAIRRRDP
jgi:uncharacterized protein (TIGR02391 family)